MRKFLPALVLLLAFFAAMTAALDAFPAFSWDEGWTGTVAHNWVTRDFYGMYLDGQPQSPGLSAAFPSVFSVAAAFQLFGIGLWQARVVFVMYMMGALAGLYALTRGFYGRRAALIALGAPVLLAPHLDMQAWYVGRTILAEAPMLFFLLLGYLFVGRALNIKNRTARIIWAVGAALFWSFGLSAKAQPIPFWMVSLGAGILFYAWRRRWRDAMMLGLVLVSSLALMQFWSAGLPFVLRGRTVQGGLLSGLVNVTALVPVWSVRADALAVLLFVGLPFVLGLVYAAWRRFRQPNEMEFGRGTLELLLWTFVASWALWFLLLSIGWARYLFPAFFVGSMFIGLVLDRVLIQPFVSRHADRTKPSRTHMAALTVLILICALFMSMTVWQIVPGLEPNGSATATTAWLNANVGRNALVETYESEILFGLQTRVHFPPDTLNVEIIRKRQIDPTHELSYDPRTVNPDYVVVGRFGRIYHVYDNLLASNYQPKIEIGTYTIYQRGEPVSTP